jgi:hypothetical protein
MSLPTRNRIGTKPVRNDRGRIVGYVATGICPTCGETHEVQEPTQNHAKNRLKAVLAACVASPVPAS